MAVGELDVMPVFDGVSSEDPTDFYRLTHSDLDPEGLSDRGLGALLRPARALRASSTTPTGATSCAPGITWC